MNYGNDNEISKFYPEAEEVIDMDITSLSKKIEENPLDYGAYVNLIKALRGEGELEELRKVHKKMNEIFPLSPDIWLSWLSDESKICSSEESRKFVQDLFRKAVKEYLSIEIWVEYIMFMLGGGKMEETRTVCEEALTAGGIHLASGILLWQAVSLVEQQYFLTLDPEDEEAVNNQRKRIQNIFRRQARVPLMNANKEEFLDGAAQWFDEASLPQIEQDFESSYKKSLDKTHFEEILLHALDDTEKLEGYRKYIDFVRKSDNPAAIQNIYERAVTDLCLNAGLWEEFVRFVMEQFSSASYIVLPVCYRSLMNCPWSSVLFDLNLLALQLFMEDNGREQTEKTIGELLNRSLRFSEDENEVINIWLSYLVYLRRKIVLHERSASDIGTFQEACANALTFIENKFGVDGDRLCRIAKFQAHFEAESLKDMDSARSIWNEHILKRNNNFKSASFWIEFINLERAYGDEKHCRKLYRRALERVWDKVEEIGASFFQFEQLRGSLDSMLDFDKRYRDRLSIVCKRRLEENMKEENRKERQIKDERMQRKKVNVDSEISGSTFKKKLKRKHSETESHSPSKFKKLSNEQNLQTVNRKGLEHGKFVEHDPLLDSKTVFLSNMDFNVTETDILPLFEDCGSIENFRIATDFSGRSKGFAYLVFANEESVEKALIKDRIPVGRRPLFISRCDPDNHQASFKYSGGLEKTKLFVRGLDASLSENEVKSLFDPCGPIKSLRLVTYRNGFSKGICYIDYHDSEIAEKVRQKMDGSVIKGHRITVLISNPSSSFGSKSNPSSSRVPNESSSSSSGSQGNNTAKAKPRISLMPRQMLPKTKINKSVSSSSTSRTEVTENSSSPLPSQKTNEYFRKLINKNDKN